MLASLHILEKRQTSAATAMQHSLSPLLLTPILSSFYLSLSLSLSTYNKLFFTFA